MQSLVIDPALTYRLPPDRPLHLVLVGCGGTGSHIAQAAARLAAHVGGSSLKLTFIDGDTVEPRNVGRQLFAPFELGRNKAQTLAARLSAALGQSITAIPAMADGEMLRHLAREHPEHLGILVGAVDTATARTALALALGNGSGAWAAWLDAGNHEASGQVALGTTTSASRVVTAFAIPGMVGALPAPSLQFPDLLTTPARTRARGEDCATQQIDNTQSLMVNQMMAAIVSEYLASLVVRRAVTRFQTVVDLHSLTMRSLPITPSAIQQACRLPVTA